MPLTRELLRSRYKILPNPDLLTYYSKNLAGTFDAYVISHAHERPLDYQELESLGFLGKVSVTFLIAFDQLSVLPKAGDKFTVNGNTYAVEGSKRELERQMYRVFGSQFKG